MKREFLVSLVFVLIQSLAFSQTALEEGKKLFYWNKPAEAKPYLESALLADPKNVEAYIYLALAYEELKEYDLVITVLQRSLQVESDSRNKIYFILGNIYSRKMEFIIAEEMFTRAIAVNTSYDAPYLNRANARVRIKKYSEAINDYEQYLVLNPFTDQRSEIEKMIAALRKFLKAEEDRKLTEKQKDEQLINEVMDSLNNAAEGTKDISVKTDEVLKSKKKDIDIED